MRGPFGVRCRPRAPPGPGVWLARFAAFAGVCAAPRRACSFGRGPAGPPSAGLCLLAWAWCRRGLRRAGASLRSARRGFRLRAGWRFRACGRGGHPRGGDGG